MDVPKYSVISHSLVFVARKLLVDVKRFLIYAKQGDQASCATSIFHCLEQQLLWIVRDTCIYGGWLLMLEGWVILHVQRLAMQL